MDAWQMREQVRDNINEEVASHWTNTQLTRRLNIEHRAVARQLLNKPGDWLMKKSAAITPVSSLITLPSDCVQPAYVEEVASGSDIPIRGTVRERNITRGIGPGGFDYGGSLEASLRGNYIVVNSTGYAEPVYVWYQARIIDLACGTLQTNTDATHLYFQLANFPIGIDDYYNGATIRVWDATTFALNVNTLITDYTGLTGVAEITSAAATPAATDKYGTVSDLPEELHELIVLRTTVRALAKPSSSFEKEIFSFWRAELKTAQEEADEFMTTRFSGNVYPRMAESD